MVIVFKEQMQNQNNKNSNNSVTHQAANMGEGLCKVQVLIR
jgi:hypothetical protein